MKIEKVKLKYHLIFPYDNKIIDFIKTLPTRSFDATNKLWVVDIISLYYFLMYCKNNNIAYEFTNIDFEKMKVLLTETRDKIKKLAQDKINLVARNANLVDLKQDYETNSSIYEKEIMCYLQNIKLFPFQITAIKYLSEIKSGLLSLQPGLGKTIISIGYSLLNKLKKVLVITPNSLKYNFLGEVDKFTDSKAFILNNKNNKYTFEESTFIIVNYEYFNSKKFDKKLKITNFGLDKVDAIILDEAHRIKNTKSHTYSNIKKTFSKVKRKLFLSGTPAPNRIDELYSTLNLINELDFPSKTNFNLDFCGMEYNKFTGWVQVKPPNLELLFNRLSPYTYRKRKEDVLKYLPDKTLQIIPFIMDNKEQKEYDDIENSLDDVNQLTILLRLRQYTAKIKIDGVKDLIDTIIENNEKVVVVDFFKESLIQLHSLYKNNSVLHIGDYSVDDRDVMKKRFMEDDNCKVFFGSVSTSKEGLTLTSASKMIIMTQSYSVGEDEQVQDRIHRIGAKNNVTIYYPMIKNTVDENILYVVENKKKQITKAIDNVNYVADYEKNVVSEIINKIKEKNKLIN